MTAWPVMPGVPAAGHVTSRGFWHPGQIDGCVKCEPAPARLREVPCPSCGSRTQAPGPCTACLNRSARRG